MNTIKLVMVDLDGTILLDHKNFSKKTEKAINQLLDNKVEVVPATGRYYHAIPEFFRNHKKINYIVSSNGALISNNKQDIFKENIDSNIVLEILTKVYGFADHVSLVTNKGMVMNKQLSFMQKIDDKEFIDAFHKQVIFVDDILEFLKLNSLKVKKIDFSFDDLLIRNRLHKKLSEFKGVNTVSSSDSNIEITAKNVSKGQALHFLKDHLDLKQYQVLAIGDSENDISMLEEAGISVAMGNASNEVKEVSDIVTESFLNDGFSLAIKKVFDY